MRNIRWDRAARDDLNELWFYIAQNNPPEADSYLDGLAEVANRYARNPLMGQAAPEELSEELGEPMRSFLYRNHRSYYAIRDDHIRILRVYHTKQDIEHRMQQHLERLREREPGT